MSAVTVVKRRQTVICDFEDKAIVDDAVAALQAPVRTDVTTVQKRHALNMHKKPREREWRKNDVIPDVADERVTEE